MNTTVTASYVVATDKIVPFAKFLGWQETVPNPVVDDMVNLTVPNPLQAIDFVNARVATLLKDFLAPFVKAQVDLKAQATLASIEASKEAEVQRVADTIVITHS
jgi:hypothetical protein